MRRSASLLLVALVGALAAACSGTKAPPRACLPVLVPRDADTLIKFRPGPGRDPTDVMFEARIADFVGTCDFARSGAATVDIKVTLDVRRGPANAGGTAAFTYFAAIPRYFPNPAGKREMPVQVAFKDALGRAVAQEELRLVLPIGRDEPTEDIPIYLGLQLTPAEIEYNKSHRQ